MEFQIVKPPCALEKYVYGYMLINISRYPYAQKVYPGGYSSVVFHMGGANYTIHDFGSPDVLRPANVMVGQVTSSYTITTYGITDVVMIMFKPSGIYRLFNFPLNQITNNDIELTDVIGAVAEDIYRKLLENKDKAHRLKVINDFLTGYIPEEIVYDPVEEVLEKINSQNGILILKDVFNDLSISERTIQRKFKEVVGLSPKQYTRIIRVNYLLKLIKQGKIRNWNEISYLGGYYDQTHFIKEIKTFTGVTPRLLKDLDAISLFNPFD